MTDEQAAWLMVITLIVFCLIVLVCVRKDPPRPPKPPTEAEAEAMAEAMARIREAVAPAVANLKTNRPYDRGDEP